MFCVFRIRSKRFERFLDNSDSLNDEYEYDGGMKVQCNAVFLKNVSVRVGGKGGRFASRCVRRMGTAGKTGTLPIHLGHQSKQQ